MKEKNIMASTIEMNELLSEIKTSVSKLMLSIDSVNRSVDRMSVYWRSSSEESLENKFSDISNRYNNIPELLNRNVINLEKIVKAYNYSDNEIKESVINLPHNLIK